MAGAIGLVTGLMSSAALGDPAKPLNFRCTSPPSAAAIELAWEAVPPNPDTGKPMRYRLSYNGAQIGSDLESLRFTLLPAMVRGGKFERDRTNYVRLQSVDQTARNAGGVLLISRWKTLDVWLRGRSSFPTSCKLLD